MVNKKDDNSEEKKRVKPGQRQQAWLDSAVPIPVTIGEQKMYLEPKCFSTGSVGYGLSGKIYLPNGDSLDKLQVSSSLIVIGSRDWK